MKPILIAGICLLCFSCGRHVDKTEDIKAGYRFKRDTVIYHEAVFWWGTQRFRHAFSDYPHLDTIDGTEYVVLVDTTDKGFPMIAPPSAGGGVVMVEWTEVKCGIGSLGGEIVVFPRFYGLQQVYGSYFSGTLSAKGDTLHGLLHASGYMVSDVAFSRFEADTIHKKIHAMVGDSLAAVFPIQ